MTALGRMLQETVRRDGTDLHIAPGYPPLARVRDALVAIGDGAVEQREVAEMLAPLLGPRERAELETDRRTVATVTEGAARFRAIFFGCAGGVGAVFRRVLHHVPSLDELACPEAVARLAERRDGLVLVCGPTRSGRTTIAAAMVDHINATRSCHVLTVEAPIELLHEPRRAQITQRQIPGDAPTFAEALFAARRDDVDVVVLSDVLDSDAVRAATDLALSGVLVLANVHATGAAAALERWVSAASPAESARVRAALSEALAGVVSQQLVESASGEGTIAVHEIVLSTPALAAIVREGSWSALAAAVADGGGAGMITMDAALERLVTIGQVTPECALERAVDKEAFARIVARVRPDLAKSLA
jgi:twitching motility protein PilT